MKKYEEAVENNLDPQSDSDSSDNELYKQMKTKQIFLEEAQIYKERVSQPNRKGLELYWAANRKNKELEDKLSQTETQAKVHLEQIIQIEKRQRQFSNKLSKKCMKIE